MLYFFRVSDFSFSLSCPDEIVPPENFLKFRTGPCEGAYRFTLFLTDTLPEPTGQAVARRDSIAVYHEAGLETRFLFLPVGADQLYACCKETSSEESRIYLCPWILSELYLDTVFTSLFALERRLIARDAMILHSSYIRYQNEAILFTAPSGTGKSTQAGLWERFRGAEQLNGDRSVLQKLHGVWHARGWPVCGSSEICHNADTPIRAIVTLSQAGENRVERLPPMDAFSRLYQQITVNRWHRDFQTRVMDRIENLISEVPVYHLACTISEDAVNCLDTALQKKL